jgi:hypothetical protein
MKAKGLLFALISLLLLAGCGSVSAGEEPPASPSPTVLHVVRTNGFLKQLAPFDRTVRDVAAVQRLYTAAYALPPAAPGVVHCPNDLGVVYHLYFLHDTTLIQEMDLDATGCQFLHISKTDVRNTDPAFRTLVARTIGVGSLLPDSNH